LIDTLDPNTSKNGATGLFIAHQDGLKVTVSGIFDRHDQWCESKKPEFIPSSSLETDMAGTVIKTRIKGMFKI